MTEHCSYRWYQKQGIAPLCAFGHGLSYTKFKYGNVKVSGGNGLSVTLEVENVGDRSGAEVPQVYLTALRELDRIAGQVQQDLAQSASVARD
jgi:beta-glucosidase